MDHCLNPCLKASINWVNKFTIILTIFLFPSVNFFLIKFIRSFNPVGNIFIFASFNIFSIWSHASFFSAHLPSDISFKICGVIFFDISLTTFAFVSVFPAPFTSFSPPFTLKLLSNISEGLLLLEFNVFILPFFSTTVTFANSASIFFKVDSFISFISLCISSP